MKEKSDNIEKANHKVEIISRGSILITGTKKIYTCMDNLIEVDTIEGLLIIKGNNLHLDELSHEASKLCARGNIDLIAYKKKRSKNKLIEWLFK